MRSIPLYLTTFNCARLPQPASALSPHLLSALPAHSSPPELIILSLQELAPLTSSFLGGSYLTPYYTCFSTAVRLATRHVFDEDYTLVAYKNVGMTAIMIFSRRASSIKWISYGGVGTGLLGMGNKGCVGARLGYAADNNTIVELTFIAAHLAPQEWALEERNSNWGAIVRGLVFTPPGRVEGLYTPTSHVFVLGDLNYRTSNSRPGALDYLVYPQPVDAVGSNTHFMELLKRDQLTAEMAGGRTMHGFVEERVEFPPTYKYKPRTGDDDGKEVYWEWSKRRWPSWTDRILYLPLQEEEGIVVHKYTSIQTIRTSDHRPVVLYVSVPSRPVLETGVRVSPPWSIDKDWKVKREAARRREIVVGIAAWLVTTRSGLGVLLALVLGVMGGWWVVKAFMLGAGRYAKLA